MSFSDKVVIITGASAGIGAATAILFAKECAALAIVGRNEERLNSVANQCSKVGKEPLVIKADVAKEDDAKYIMDKTIAKYGKIDVLVNNAGIIREAGILDDNLMDTYDEIMNTNMRAVMLLTSIAAPHLIKTGGNIVNVSSVAGYRVTGPQYMSYKVSKAALNHFTRISALDLARYGVRVNGICPGPTKTDIFNFAGLAGGLEKLQNQTALNKLAESEEVGELILFVASDKAKSITGSNYTIDNGIMLK